jgi:hypothetical protein
VTHKFTLIILIIFSLTIASGRRADAQFGIVRCCDGPHLPLKLEEPGHLRGWVTRTPTMKNTIADGDRLCVANHGHAAA